MAAKKNMVGWLSISGAAAYSGFSEPSIRTAIDLKKFPTYEVDLSGAGKKSNIRIRPGDIDAWIEGRSAGAIPTREGAGL